jgi:hypothetical protein
VQCEQGLRPQGLARAQGAPSRLGMRLMRGERALSRTSVVAGHTPVRRRLQHDRQQRRWQIYWRQQSRVGKMNGVVVAGWVAPAQALRAHVYVRRLFG